MPPKIASRKRAAAALAPSPTSPKKARHRITIDLKREVARRIEVDQEDIDVVRRDFIEENRLEVTKRQVQDWIVQFNKGVYENLPGSANRVTANGNGPSPRFALMEKALAAKIGSSQKRGEHISKDWIEAMARSLLRYTNPKVDVDAWSLSAGYFARFKKRRGISLRAFTKKQSQQKAKDPMKEAVNLLRYLRKRVLAMVDGPFEPSMITAVDEVPNLGCVLGHKTYAPRGAREIPMAPNMMRNFKYTALYPFCENGVQRARPVLIFEPDPDMSEEDRCAEEAQYHPDCVVYWQKNHFVDGENFEDWLQNHWKPTCTTVAGKPHVCMMDSVASHNTNSIKQWFRRNKHINALIPAFSTSFLQVGDVWPHSVIKLGVAAQEKAWLNTGRNRRAFYNGHHKPRDRRPLLTHWQVAAYTQFHENHRVALIGLFRKLGYTLNPSGREDAELKITGCPNIARYLGVDQLSEEFLGLGVSPGDVEEVDKNWWDDIGFSGQGEEEEEEEEEEGDGGQDVDLNDPDVIWLLDDTDDENKDDARVMVGEGSGSVGKGKSKEVALKVGGTGTAEEPFSID